ncbi:MAG: hypothetical protein AABZ35_03675 [Gemmatimonadota bacterium]|jgi:hypothetical protein
MIASRFLRARRRVGSIVVLSVGPSVILFPACYRSPARSRPLPSAIQATTTRSVREASSAALAAFNADGIGIERFRPDTGLVESTWFDIANLETAARDYPRDEREVRFRFLAVADTMDGPVRLYLEVTQHAVDPLGSRRREREAPRDHPAMDVARRLMDRVTGRLGR